MTSSHLHQNLDHQNLDHQNLNHQNLNHQDLNHQDSSGKLTHLDRLSPRHNRLARLLGRSILSSMLILGMGMVAESVLRVDFSSAFAQVESQTQSQLLLAQAQFTEEQINRYAGAVNAIEKKREEILRRAKNSQGWSTVAQTADSKGVDVCSLNQSEQPADIQSLCRELIDFSEQEIRKYGFSNNREFNQLTVTQQQDPSLQGRIQARMLQLRGYR
ncbi:DUF4168 domain-containing protein [Tumidithrix elongata RA019]|uniref:DUF4168 domain-containing protein n=1 Tax=Tumidithrix elongata BACA0141 TaxID=2716417 RepID=A0AAW9Q125_9CYAN|nr:DUF4168 domain-containing protein [Tumidithrix elongata RA019]